MATVTKTAADAAYDTIVNNLAAPYFFEKLAANGIVPQSQKEASDMWAVASKLHTMYNAEQEKIAAANESRFAGLNSELDQILAATGLTSAQASEAEKSATFDAAASVAADSPEIASAVLTLQAEAQAALQAK